MTQRGDIACALQREFFRIHRTGNVDGQHQLNIDRLGHGESGLGRQLAAQAEKHAEQGHHPGTSLPHNATTAGSAAIGAN